MHRSFLQRAVISNTYSFIIQNKAEEVKISTKGIGSRCSVWTINSDLMVLRMRLAFIRCSKIFMYTEKKLLLVHKMHELENV
jgi:hypothetical protein